MLQVTNHEKWRQLQSMHAAQKMQMLQSGRLTLNGKTMIFQYHKKGQRPPNGYTLIFGFHGGGGTDKATNDSQFNNHKHLYDQYLPQGSIWFVPRSCQDVWDMWFRDYMEDFIFQFIHAFALNNEIDLNKVFLTGYSAGGDGVYHMGPRMADHLAGAAMMAGHPNGINLMNVRNIGYSVQVGGQDNAYNRKNEAIKYGRILNQLGQNYGGYQHRSQIHEGMPHWMGTKDAKIFNWLFGLTRNPYPDTILYKQCPRRSKSTFYYLRFGQQKNGVKQEEVLAFKDGNTFRLFGNRSITVLVNRNFVNPQQPITIYHNNKITVQRNMQTRQDVMQKTLLERMDPYYIFQDEFVSEPPVPVDMKSIFLTQFAITPAQKQAQYQPSLPTQVSQTPGHFRKSMDTLVKRNAPLPQRSNFNPMRLQASNFDNNQQIQSFGNIPNQNNYYNPSPAQLSSPSPWDKQTPPINYGQNPNQNLSTPQNQTYGQPQTNQYQYNNPYDQYGQQRSNKPGCLDDCRIF